MTQSRYGILLNLCLLLLLAAGFFLASKVVYTKLHNSIETAIATATIVVLPPTPTHPLATATPKGGVKPTATPPPPTDTPGLGSAQVLIGTSQNPSSAATTFAKGTPVFYCMVNLPNVPESTPITFRWVAKPANTLIFPYTGTYASAFKYSFVNGPFSAGQYACTVSAPVNNIQQVVGSTTFTVQ